MQLVLDDRPADVAREDVEILLRLGRARRQVERRRRHRRAAEAIRAVALDRVRARRRDRVVDDARRLAELRRVAGRDDLHLADHHFGHRHQPESRAILLRVRVAVDLVVDAQQRAVRAEARHAELRVLVADDARLEQREVVRVARDERQVLHLALVDVAAHVDLAEIDGRRLGRDRDRFRHGADLQRLVQHERESRRRARPPSARASRNRSAGRSVCTCRAAAAPRGTGPTCSSRRRAACPCRC